MSEARERARARREALGEARRAAGARIRTEEAIAAARTVARYKSSTDDPAWPDDPPF